MNDTPGIYLNNKYLLLHPYVRGRDWAKPLTRMISLNPHNIPQELLPFERRGGWYLERLSHSLSMMQTITGRAQD